MDIKKPGTKSSHSKKKSPHIEGRSSSVSGFTKSTAIVVGLVWFFALIVATLSLVYSVVYAHVTFPGTHLSGKDVSNLSRQDLSQNVSKRITAVNKSKWTLTYRDKTTEASVADLGFSFNDQKTTEVIWNYGRTENFFVNLKDQVRGLFGARNFSPVETLNEQVAQDFINSKLAKSEEQPKNATISYKGKALHVESSTPGRVLDARIALNDISNNIAQGSIEKISVIGYLKTPAITSTIAQASREKFVTIAAKPIKLSYDSKTWTLDSTDISSWITPVAAEVRSQSNDQDTSAHIIIEDKTATLVSGDTPQTDLVLTQTAAEIKDIVASTAQQDEPLNIREFMAREFGLDKNILASNPSVLAVAIDKAKLDKTFDPITEKIDVPGKNVRLAFADGKMTVIEGSKDGRGVDRVDALKKILAAVNDNASHDIALVVNTIPAKVTENNYQSLGIKELLATGDSNFVGSPKNRQHNIRTAASHFEGVLVAPGEEFSFVSYLGDVDASTGYLPELVIKGNKITPEFGGGVCQVSSTLFRAAVYSGLEITERQNHSFVVSYYGTPGMDATIYIPHPDLKFVNNTPGYILMQPRFDGTHLSFDIFGTKDGRKVETQGPYIFARGAGNSMKATWTQIVTTAAGETRTKVFKSSYKPVTDFVHTN